MLSLFPTPKQGQYPNVACAVEASYQKDINKLKIHLKITVK